MLTYIFVLVMEVLTQFLNAKALEEQLGYHLRCKELEITHLTFANDLLIFTDCSESSYIAIYDVFDTFYKLFGLKLSSNSLSFMQQESLRLEHNALQAYLVSRGNTYPSSTLGSH